MSDSTTAPKAPEYPKLYINFNCPPVVVGSADQVTALGPEYRPYTIPPDVLDVADQQLKQQQQQQQQAQPHDQSKQHEGVIGHLLHHQPHAGKS